MARPLKALADLTQHLEEHRPIGIVEIDVLASITPRGDVIQRACKFDAKGSGHILKPTPKNDAIQDSRPDPFLCFVAPLENVPDASVPAVGALGEYPVQLTHTLGQCRIAGFDQQMVVIAHQAVGMARPLEPLADLTQHLEEHRPIGIVDIDVLASITTRGDVIQRACKFDARGRAIFSNLRRKTTRFKIQDLTPFFQGVAVRWVRLFPVMVDGVRDEAACRIKAQNLL
ncbi:hypothetical protein, partial [Dokdonella immobilis]|uniref:hypothetical protein n=1 Tax=Dokdonella immobilis TaxID=578942 RepID=UPI001FE77290